jgi:hypothetical protein
VEGFTPDLTRQLREAGCRFVRQGCGDREIRHSPITGTHFVVDSRIRSRHTANPVLRQPGLPKRFRPPCPSWN